MPPFSCTLIFLLKYCQDVLNIEQPYVYNSLTTLWGNKHENKYYHTRKDGSRKQKDESMDVVDTIKLIRLSWTPTSVIVLWETASTVCWSNMVWVSFHAAKWSRNRDNYLLFIASFFLAPMTIKKKCSYWGMHWYFISAQLVSQYSGVTLLCKETPFYLLLIVIKIPNFKE